MYNSNFLLIFAPHYLLLMFKAKLEMKTKLFLAAVAVAFSFAVTSCGNKKAANTEVEATEVEVVEEVQACDSKLAARQILLLAIAQKLAAKRKKNVIKLATRSNSYHIGSYKKGAYVQVCPFFVILYRVI